MVSKWSVNDIPDLKDKIAIVTGANSGLGYEDARALIRMGATVILACRDMDKAGAALKQIYDEKPDAKAEIMQIDLADLASIRRFADGFIGKHERLDILINNAGLMIPPLMRTADGFEIQFGTNHLGHFALTGLLLDMIINTPKARVVTLSSEAHSMGGKIDFDNLNAEKGYNKYAAYSQSKLANLLFTYELQRRFEAVQIDALAVAAHPMGAATNLLRYSNKVLKMILIHIAMSAEKGALPTLYAATSPDVKGGDYFGPSGLMAGFIGRRRPVKVQSSERSHDKTVARKLWEVSEELTGVTYHQLAK